MILKYILVVFLLATATATVLAKENEPEENRYLLEFLSDLELFSNMKLPVLENAVLSGVWNKSKSAFAFCAKGIKTLCLVLIKNESSYKSVDVTAVEAGNFGKLGRNISFYDKYTTKATKWIERKDGLLQIEFLTYAWKNSQRYTAKEPLLLNKSGEPLYR